MKEQDLNDGSMAPTSLPLILSLNLIVLRAGASQSWVLPIIVNAFLASSCHTWNLSAYRDPEESKTGAQRIAQCCRVASVVI